MVAELARLAAGGVQLDDLGLTHLDRAHGRGSDGVHAHRHGIRRQGWHRQRDPDAKTSADPSFLAEVSRVLARACADCHGGISPAAQLSLEAGTSYGDLVNVPAAVSCRGEPRVTPGDPDHSVLLLKMSGADCGQRMPPTNPTYYDHAPDELALVRTWIQNGAPDN
ncbi:MAG TPA: c-type cytochrome domain-containing protein [Myxococcaceae bacterium]|nr:c-type cytochrome domain-containing protein [Myxococcaceae bacterium]